MKIIQNSDHLQLSLKVQMIFDLTQQIKNEMNQYPETGGPSYSDHKISANLKLYATYSEDIYQLLMKIRTILNDNREHYFSNASFSFEAFSDRQREELNQSLKNNLQSVLSQINQLSQGLKKHSWFRKKTEEEHMKAVVLCLYQLFKSIQKIYIEFEEFSLKRKKKIHDTVSIDKQDQKGKYHTPVTVKKRQFTDEDLEKEASLLVLEKKSKQRNIEETKSQIQKIHELMSNMSNVVLEQELKTGILHGNRLNWTFSHRKRKQEFGLGQYSCQSNRKMVVSPFPLHGCQSSHYRFFEIMIFMN